MNSIKTPKIKNINSVHSFRDQFHKITLIITVIFEHYKQS